MADDKLDDVSPAPPSPNSFDGFVRENPIAAVVGALIVGILLGRLGIL
jgi:hypothetical protein